MIVDRKSTGKILGNSLCVTNEIITNGNYYDKRLDHDSQYFPNPRDLIEDVYFSTKYILLYIYRIFIVHDLLHLLYSISNKKPYFLLSFSDKKYSILFESKADRKIAEFLTRSYL